MSINITAMAQRRREPPLRRVRNVSAAVSRLTGVYRLDVGSSDKLYSVVAGASSNLPTENRQRFFDDLTVRLAAPDQLAIEQRGARVSLASSRAPRISFEADNIERTEQATDGRIVRTRATLRGEELTVSTGGNRRDDKFTVVFDLIDEGRRLRVTRRISAEELDQPIVIQSVYNKIANVARWSIYGEPQTVPASEPVVASTAIPRSPSSPSPATEDGAASVLRASLDEWIAATNARDINRQLTFYAPKLNAFYLTRNVSRDFVRAEKARVFARARVIDVRAELPEIIFSNEGRTSIMRFRKSYVIEGGEAGTRRGEVVQELRWQQTGAGWKIISERDVRVLR
ncbi:MAG: hypothetical protein ABR577_09495 [Pyrinomonadaceae bacterium]